MAELLDPISDPIAASNRTHCDFPDQVTLHELFEAQVRRHPDRIAVRCDHDGFWGQPTLTYRELNVRANQVANRLRLLGVKSGQIVGVLTERSFAMVIGLYGILKAGAAYLPLSTDDPVERVSYVLRDAGVTLLLVHGATLEKAPQDATAINLERADLYAEGAEENPGPIARPDDLAYVIYTSGSTGRPKGVMIEHRSVVNRLHWMQSAYPLGANDVLLQKTPYCFDVSVWELFWWACEGASVSMLRPRGERLPQVLLETIRRDRVTVAHFVPSMLNVFLDYVDGRPEKVTGSLATLQRVFASGEALSPVHVRKFNEAVGRLTGCRLTNLYGPTEATVDATYFDCPNEDAIDAVPIGRPIQNMKAYLLRDGQLVAPGETGELCLAGVGLARGYLNNPELTREKFIATPLLPGERLYRTGDVARWRPDGNLEYLGREDTQVKIRGLRIELGEIENTIRRFPGISDCVVTTRQYADSIVVIAAYFVAKESVSIDALKRHLQQQLAEYMVPTHFEAIAEIPLTASGKADRKALPEPATMRRAS